MPEANAPDGPLWLYGGGTREHSAVAYRRLLGSLVPIPGVCGPSDMQVTAPGGILGVNVGGGAAVIAGTNATGQGSYHAYEVGSKQLLLAPADASLARVDRIVAVVGDADYGGSDGFTIEAITGVPANPPLTPAAPATSIDLATVAVAAGAPAIASGNITDLRTAASPGNEPVGTVKMVAATSTPLGFLPCNGQLVSRTLYARLFAAIGTTFGAGDGSTTFQLPDFRGRSPIGTGQGAGLTNRGIGAQGGEEAHTSTANEMPSHNHGVTDPGHKHAVIGDGGNRFLVTVTTAGYAVPATGIQNVSFTAMDVDPTGVTINNAGGGAEHNNMQPYLAVSFIIKF